MQRKLTAILSADVVGYSGLMEADETGTLERLKANRSTIFDPHVATHGGRVFKLLGDGALVEFSSVVAAVNCALAIQEATEKAGADDAKPIRYRIGVNLGDIIIDGDDIYGEGVNVAARLQTLAPVGGIALSKMVRDSVEGKAPCAFDDMGEHTVKNIERPVHVFSVRATGRNEPEGHKVEEPRKLSICVLPFANMSGDVEQEYFSDGISEDIITDLSKVSALSVVARNTSFQFKGKSVDVQQVARQLKVSHVLEGSVRKAGGRVRITAQLIDGSAGDHVWAERYDRDLNDIFALQDEISEAIVKALKLKLLPEEKKAIEQRGTDNVDAYNLYLMARQYYLTSNYGSLRTYEVITRLCNSAAEIDPSYARAWALMAIAQNYLLLFFAKGDGGLEAAARALSLDANLGEAHAAKARFLVSKREFDEAQREVEAALALEPQSYDVNRSAAYFYYLKRLSHEAICYYEKAAALLEGDFYSLGLAIDIYTAVGDFDGALDAARRCLDRAEKALAHERDNGSAMSCAAIALATLGESDRANELTKRAILIDPDNSFMGLMLGTASIRLNQIDFGLDLFRHALAKASAPLVNVFRIHHGADPVREYPQFKAMMAAAVARLAAEDAAAAKSPPS